MNIDDALDMLVNARSQNIDWRGGRHDDHFENQQFPGHRFPTGPSGQMGFPPVCLLPDHKYVEFFYFFHDYFIHHSHLTNTIYSYKLHFEEYNKLKTYMLKTKTNQNVFQGGSAGNLLTNMNGTSSGANNSLINNMSPAIVQKMLSQSGGLQGFGGANSAGGRSLQTPSQPSSAQLRMLVQQIQMAVQAGYLNHQILNQPLAPQTLVLLNQLLQQIKTLQQLTNQQNLAQTQCIGPKQNNALLHCSVLITKTKQQISNLQVRLPSF